MNDFFGIRHNSKFQPEPSDSIRELRWKAESMLEDLREKESFLRQFPTSALDERLALWRNLAVLLANAMADPSLEQDAAIEAHRVWAEETRHAALNIVTMCAHARSDAAQDRFREDPELLEELIVALENQRPAALKVLTTADLRMLRDEGYLRPGE